MDAEKVHLAEKIDTWVLAVVNNGGDDEQILEGMHVHMDTFKQLLDTCSKLEMTLLSQRYDGFYRFANLLERLAQGIADGVIQVPKDAPLSTKPSRPKKKRILKPKPRKRQAKKKKQIRHPISQLPLFTEMIMGTAVNTEEQFDSFMAARHKPHVLDDAIVDRALRLYRAQLEDLALDERQLNWWLEEDMTKAQQYQINDLLAKLSSLRERTQGLLDLLAELKQGTIDRILEMDDEELGRQFLRGELGDLSSGE